RSRRARGVACRAGRRAASFVRGTRGSCGEGTRGRWPADPETPRPSAQGKSAASAAENWPDCDRGRGHKAKETSSGAPTALRGDHSAVPQALGQTIGNPYGRKAKNRKPTKVKTIAAPLPAATNSGRIAGVTATPARGASKTQAE